MLKMFFWMLGCFISVAFACGVIYNYRYSIPLQFGYMALLLLNAVEIFIYCLLQLYRNYLASKTLKHK